MAMASLVAIAAASIGVFAPQAAAAAAPKPAAAAPTPPASKLPAAQAPPIPVAPVIKLPADAAKSSPLNAPPTTPLPPPPGPGQAPAPLRPTNAAPPVLGPDGRAPAGSAGPGAKEGWTTRSHWKANANGSRTVEAYPEPAFRNTASGWVAIDPTLKAATTAGFALAAEGAIRPVRFGTDASHLVQLGLDHGPVTLSPPASPSPRPD